MDTLRYPLTIYYDGSCQLCSAEIRNLQLRDTQAHLRFVDCSPADFISPVPGADRAALMNAIHGVDAGGQVLRAVDLFEAAYRAVGLPCVSRLMAHPLIRPLADCAYPWVVRNRYRLPRGLIHGVFERAARRAAERAARQARCDGEACRLPTERRS